MSFARLATSLFLALSLWVPRLEAAHAFTCPDWFQRPVVEQISWNATSPEFLKGQLLPQDRRFFEMRFADLGALIDLQNLNPDFTMALYEKSFSFALDLPTAEKAKFLSMLPNLRTKAMRGAVNFRNFNNLFFDYLIPTSYFARTLSSTSGFPSADEVEARLESETYLKINRDGSAVLTNFGYREAMSESIKAFLKANGTEGEPAPLKVFRGMKETEALFINFLGQHARREACSDCRTQLAESLRRFSKTNLPETLSDDEFLKEAYSVLYTKRPYLFTTPDSQWARNWGEVYELSIDFLALDPTLAQKTYVAADSAHNLRGVIEVDFPVRRFEDALELFKWTRISQARIKEDANRQDLSGREIPLVEDERSVSFE